MSNASGASIIELLVALTITGILAGLAIPRARRGLDGLQVRGARDAAFGLANRTRSVALARGGAEFVVELKERTAFIADGTGVEVARVSLADYGVEIAADGAASTRIVLRYDGHGIGRMASRTIRFRRGAIEAGLTFSSYGRARRW